MATTLTTYYEPEGSKTHVIQGTVGTAVAKLVNARMPARVILANHDATAANAFYIGTDNEAMATTAGFAIWGGNTNSDVVIDLGVGQTLNAVAAADRVVSLVVIT